MPAMFLVLSTNLWDKKGKQAASWRSSSFKEGRCENSL